MLRLTRQVAVVKSKKDIGIGGSGRRPTSGGVVIVVDGRKEWTEKILDQSRQEIHVKHQYGPSHSISSSSMSSRKRFGEDGMKMMFSSLSTFEQEQRTSSRKDCSTKLYNHHHHQPMYGSGLVSTTTTMGRFRTSNNTLNGMYTPAGSNQLLCNAGPFNHQSRTVSSWLPEVVQNFSIWGGTGPVLKMLHYDGVVPYWACFALMNTMLRVALIPLVLYSAHTSSRFAKVAPELQFIITLFQNDLKKMRSEGKTLFEQRYLFLQNLQTVRNIYKLHNINPLSVFLSPFLQIPFFYYVAVDLRKIVNGADPALAQELCESSFYWVPDLTDPDPWYGLPIAAGAMLYFNVEVAIGKRSLSGPTAAKSDFAGLLKDIFQTLAVFMPCFASQSPAGLQIYLVSSFTFTLFQSAALRNDTVRTFVGLPSLGTPPTEPKYAKEFMEFKRLEQKAKEIRGDGPVLGRNVLAVGFETSFPGTDRPSTIEGSGIKPVDPAPVPSTALSKHSTLSMEQASAAWGGNFIHGVSAPMEQLEAQMADYLKEEQAKIVAKEEHAKKDNDDDDEQAEAEAAMEAANRGAILAPKKKKIDTGTTTTIDSKQFKKKRQKSQTKRKR